MLIQQILMLFGNDATCSLHTGPRGMSDSPSRTPEPPLLGALPELVSHVISGTGARSRCQAHSAARAAATSATPPPTAAPIAAALLCGAGAARKE